ncbi:hypothetical protein [Kordia jejudonensis]|uniref:hypothetical protein n=1 Tax=Kordia jejudonensis TaxID=1348245 RepID=UPI000629B0E9|nr:hypothetical protein [Kordia jejudonensis]
MTKLKLTISLFLLLFYSSIISAQDVEINEFKSLSSEIFSFINNLNDNIVSFFDKEKAKNVERNLRYFQNDLREYLKTRKKLMDYISQNNYVIDNVKTKPLVAKLKKKLEKLSTRLAKVTPYINAEMSSHAEYIIDKIHQTKKAQQELFLSELDKLINGQSIDKEKLIEDGLRIYNELSKSIDLISVVRENLKKVYKK